MENELTHVVSENHLTARLDGNWTIQDFQLAIKDISETCQEVGHTNILIDFRNMVLPLGIMYHFDAAISISELLRPPMRVVALSGLNKLDPFMEDVAVNRGANFRIQSDEAKAIEWLLETN
jgi:hypothetical protein